MSQSAGPDLVRSRFTLLDRPVAAPGNCKVCGAADRPVIDFGANDEFGAIYFCTECLTEVAKGALHLVDATELDEARLAIIELTEKLNSLGGDLDGYISNLRDLYDTFILGVHRVPGADSAGAESIHGHDDRKELRTVSDSGIEQPSSDKSVISEGPVSIPTDSGNVTESVFGNL